MRAEARAWRERRLDTYDDRACSLRAGDAYTLPGLSQARHVGAVGGAAKCLHERLRGLAVTGVDPWRCSPTTQVTGHNATCGALTPAGLMTNLAP
ncbi:hypothetical protein [Streptomyces sp. N2A]|uniref:hypothetical protein n=1 Tax=Streptomyces sp. N2A TaxID=3073936 RepID=UPI0028700B64|nr:hypothetical protein [Streptomyces sp. N2A]